MANNTERNIRVRIDGDAKGLAAASRQAQREMRALQKQVDAGRNAIVASSMGIGLGIGGMAATAVAGASTAALALAAVPIAFAAIGIAALKENVRVKTAFTDLKNHVVKETQTLAAPLIPVLEGVATKLKSTFDQIAPSLGKIFTALGPQITTLVGGLTQFVTNAMPGFTTAIEKAGPVIDSISKGLAGIGTALGDMFTRLAGESGNAAAGLDMLFAAVNWLIGAFTTFLVFLTGQVIPFIQQYKDELIILAGVVTGLVITIKAITAAMALYNTIINVVKAATVAWGVVQRAFNLVMMANPFTIVIAVIALLVAAIIWAWNNCETFRNIVLAVWNAVKNGITAAVNQAKSVINWFGQLPGLIGGWFGRAKDGAVNAFQSMVSWVSGVPGRILSALGNIGSMLLNSGRSLVDGFLSGIKGAWGRITGFVESGMQKLRNLWPFSPAKEGPFSGKGYVTHSGKAMTTDFANSLKKGMPGVVAAASGLMDAASLSLSPRVSTASAISGISIPANQTQVTVEIDGQEFKGMVRTQINEQNRQTRRTVTAGRMS